MNKWSDSYIFFLMGLLRVLGIIVVMALGAWFLMLAWNYVMPVVFHLPSLDILQAFCLGYVFRTLLNVQGARIENNGNNQSPSLGGSNS